MAPRGSYAAPSAELDALLSRRGVAGCTALDDGDLQLLPPPDGGKTGDGLSKQGVTLALGTFRGEPVVAMRCAGGAEGAGGARTGITKACWQVGVGTLLLATGSPFMAQLRAFCPPRSNRAGTVVVERMAGGLSGGRAGSARASGAAEHLGVDWSAEERKAGRSATAPQNGAYLAANAQLATSLARRVLGVLGGVAELHASGRLVADFASRQFMLDQDGRVKLVDVDCMLERGKWWMTTGLEAGFRRIIGTSAAGWLADWPAVAGSSLLAYIYCPAGAHRPCLYGVDLLCIHSCTVQGLVESIFAHTGALARRARRPTWCKTAPHCGRHSAQTG